MNYTLSLIFSEVKSLVFTSVQLLEIQCTAVYNGPVLICAVFFLHSFNPLQCDQLFFVATYSFPKFLPFI